MAEMKAVVIYAAGGPDVLTVQSRLNAVGLDCSELFTRQAHSPGVKFPRVLGIEAVGLVEEAPGGECQKGDVVASAMGGMGREFAGGEAGYRAPRPAQRQKKKGAVP